MKNIILTVGLVLLAVYFLPFSRINWGKIGWQPGETVTVTGEAISTQKNQIAVFSAGVDALNDSKENAVKEVNTKLETLIKAVKDFGVRADDIKTSNLSIYQNEESYYDNGVQKFRKGQWRVSNQIEITLREIDRADKLTDLLSSSGANNVYGPNFQFDDVREVEVGLFDEAMKNASEKAQALAKASSRKLGKVLTVSEGMTQTNLYPMYGRGAEGGGGAPIEPGSGTVSKTVTVVFELK